MKQQIFSIYDSKAEAYNTPFYLPNENMAVREFTNLANDADSTVSKHPADYTLFHLGEYDDGGAEFTIFDAKVSLGIALEFKNVTMDKESVSD